MLGESVLSLLVVDVKETGDTYISMQYGLPYGNINTLK